MAATCLDLEIIILSEVSQTEKDKCQRYHLYAESKNDTNLFKKQTHLKKNRFTDIENKLSQKERVGGGIN